MTDTYDMPDWSDEQLHLFCKVSDVFEYYGYSILSEPLVGSFDLWLSCLDDEAKKLERRAQSLRDQYGVRGRSKRLLKMLHLHRELGCGVEILGA